MEFLIAFGVTLIIGSIISIGRRQGQKTKPNLPPDSDEAKTNTEHQAKLKQADEEFITVILPTINNDK